MANYVVSDTNLTAVANAIRQKGGTSASLEFPDDFVEAIGDIQTGGGSSVTVEALNVTQNGTYTAPAGTAYSPVTVSVSGSGTDYLVARLENTLTSYSSNDVTSVMNHGFRDCTSLQSVSLPNATSIGEYAFYGCSSLTSISLPKYTLADLPQSCFRNCTSLTNVELPVDYSGILRTYCFAGCKSLEEIDLQKTNSINDNCFNGSSSLTTIVIRRTSVAVLSNTNVFTGTPFASNGSGGTLYVPETLIASYQSAYRWTNILGYTNNQIKKIEGSIYE